MGKSKSNVEQLNTLPTDLAALSWSLGGKQATLVSGVIDGIEHATHTRRI